MVVRRGARERVRRVREIEKAATADIDAKVAFYWFPLFDKAVAVAHDNLVCAVHRRCGYTLAFGRLEAARARPDVRFQYVRSFMNVYARKSEFLWSGEASGNLERQR